MRSSLVLLAVTLLASSTLGLQVSSEAGNDVAKLGDFVRGAIDKFKGLGKKKKKKSNGLFDSPSVNNDLEEDVDNLQKKQSGNDENYPTFIQQICESFVDDRQHFKDGMFRVPANLEKWNKLKAKMESNVDEAVDEFKKLSGDTKQEAGLLKSAIRDHAKSADKPCLIPLTDEQITQLTDENAANVVKEVKTLAKKSIAKDYFKCFSQLAVNIIKEKDTTKMHTSNLAIAVGPSAICAEDQSLDKIVANMQAVQKIVAKFFDGALAESGDPDDENRNGGDDDERVQEQESEPKPMKTKQTKTKQSGGSRVDGDDDERVQEQESEPKSTKQAGGGHVKSLVQKFENMAD